MLTPDHSKLGAVVFPSVRPTTRMVADPVPESALVPPVAAGEPPVFDAPPVVAPPVFDAPPVAPPPLPGFPALPDAPPFPPEFGAPPVLEVAPEPETTPPEAPLAVAPAVPPLPFDAPEEPASLPEPLLALSLHAEPSASAEAKRDVLATRARARPPRGPT
jgi:hypothetical protein